MASNTEAIRSLNDAFRTALVGGRVRITEGVCALPELICSAAVEAVQRFDAFSEDNDPYGEHDFGSFEIGGHTFFWKIDYYDRTLEFGSSNPSDPAVTTRVLTLMLAEEY